MGGNGRANGPRRSRIREVVLEILITACITGSVLLTVQWYVQRQHRPPAGPLKVGMSAPGFELPEIRTDHHVRLASLRGKPTIVNFWATWCGPCKHELPRLDRFYRSAHGAFHLVTVVEEPPSAVLPLLRARHLSLPVLYDATGEVQRAYRVSRIPMTVIIDSHGKIVRDFVGEANLDDLRATLHGLHRS